MNNHGFVRAGVMEGMIIVAVIGIIAAIAIPQYINYKNRNLNKEAKIHAYQAYEATRALFRANPKAKPTLEEISRYGYQISPDISVTIGGSKDSFCITTMHIKSNKRYRINEIGELSSD